MYLLPATQIEAITTTDEKSPNLSIAIKRMSLRLLINQRANEPNEPVRFVNG